MTTTAADMDQVYRQLVDRIFSGDLPPGAPLVERKLAEELGVSRMPVREALSRLVAQGALQGGDHRRSVRLRRYTADEIGQLFCFREMIEGGAARGAAEHATSEQLARLHEICRAAEAEIGQRRTLDRWTDLEHQFHDTIAQASGNEWIATSLHLLLQQSHYVFYRMRWRVLSELSDAEVRRVREQTVRTHRVVLERIAAGDGDGAETAMRQHIRASYEDDA